MKLPATNKTLVLHGTKRTTPPEQTSSTGWDPFEVWRTRVLLPRLAEEREEANVTPPAPPRLVRP